TAKGLLSSRVPAKNVLRMLSSLKRQLPDDRHLATIKIYADGRRVVAWDGRARWQPDSGQFVFNFEAHDIAQKLNISRPAPKPSFNLGVLMEDLKSFPKAIRAYTQAIRNDPSFADAHCNLGLLFEAMGNKAKAIAHLRAARKIYLGR